MRYFPAITALLLSSTALTLTPARADDMLVNALKKVSELEAKNIALEVNHHRLEEEYKALQERNNKLEQSYRAKEALLKKSETKPSVKLASKSIKQLPTSQATVTSKTTQLEEITKVAFEGAYIGVNGGYGGGDNLSSTDAYLWTSNQNNIGFLGPTVQHINSVDRSGGALAGVQFGYNYIFSNNLMLGAEADFDWSDISSLNNTRQTGYLPGKGSVGNSSARNGINWLSTERVRIGYNFGSFLPYLTGGLAISNAQNKLNFAALSLDNNVFANVTTAETNFTGVGWSAGAGLEYSLLKEFTLKTEYMYAQIPSLPLNGSNVICISSTNAIAGISTKGMTSNLGYHQIRVGLNYHPHFFDQPAQAIASKY